MKMKVISVLMKIRIKKMIHLISNRCASTIIKSMVSNYTRIQILNKIH